MDKGFRADEDAMEGRVIAVKPEDVDEVVAAMLERDRHSGASVLDRALGEAAERLIASSLSGGSSRTLVAAQDLVHRGDQASARLLLRAVAWVAPDRALTKAAKQLRPAGAMRRRVKVVTSMALAIGLLAGGMVAAAALGADTIATAFVSAGVGAAMLGRVAWVLRVRLPGLTLQESILWRSLGVLRRGDIRDLTIMGDGSLRRALIDIKSPRAQGIRSVSERPDNSGWVGLAGVLGAVLAPVGGLAIPGFPPGGYLALMPVGATVAALAMWGVLRSHADGPRHRSSSR